MWNLAARTIKAWLGLVLVLGVLTSALPASALTTQSTTLLQNATAVQNCTVVTNCPLVDVKGYTTVVFQVLGTFTGSVQFEASVNKNLGFTPLECFSAANRVSACTEFGRLSSRSVAGCSGVVSPSTWGKLIRINLPTRAASAAPTRFFTYCRFVVGRKHSGRGAKSTPAKCTMQ